MNKMQKFRFNKLQQKFPDSTKGSLTVEASLVFPIVVLAIAMIIYITFLMYQFVYADASINLTLKRSIPVLQNADVDISTGRVEAEGLREPLYVLFDIDKERISMMQNFYIQKSRRFGLLTPNERSVEIEAFDNFVFQQIVITVEENFSLPTGGIFDLLGLGNVITRKTKASYIGNEPEEIIRLVDYSSLVIQARLQNQQSKP